MTKHQKPTDSTASLVISAQDCKELSQRLDIAKVQYQVHEAPAEESILSYDVEAIRTLVVASTPVLVAFAHVLAVYLKERNKQLVVKDRNGDIEITSKNLKSDEIIEVIRALKRDQQILIIEE